MNDRQKTTLIHAINHFGVEANIDKALEEMGELTTELSRRRLARYDKDKVAEEIADVLITVEKLRIIFGGSKVDGYIEKKLAALEDEMDGDWRRQERMMPKGMVKHREKEESESRKCSLVGECVEAGMMAGLKFIDPDLVEKLAKARAVVIPANDIRERVAAVDEKLGTNNGDPVDVRRCCLFCRHIVSSQIPEFFGPYCGLTGQEILGNPRLMTCGRFEPTLEEREDGLWFQKRF